MAARLNAAAASLRPLLSRRLSSLTPSAHASSRHCAAEDEEFASPNDMSFVPRLKIVKYPHPILRARNKPINTFDDNLKKLVAEMFDLMYRTDGIGLSAPQVGINVQLMVLDPGVPGEGKEMVLINPKVLEASQRILPYNEGCLSFPDIFADIERPASVEVDACDINGGKFRVNLSGLPARVFQHEFDHLEGLLFVDRMTSDVLESISSDLKALEQKYERSTGLPSSESIDEYLRSKVVEKADVGFVKR